MKPEIARRRLLAGAAAAIPVAARADAVSVPQVDFGPHKLSRLIVGGNPVSGNSHWSAGMSREMADYFTAANVKRLLERCERAGVNTWQSRGDKHIQRLLHEYRLEGGKIQWIAQTASELADIPRHFRDLAAQKPIGIYHHGATTDKMFRAGRMRELREMLKTAKDTGVRIGLGTHMPEVIDQVESEGWDVDFYMTCLYNLSRTKEEIERTAGGPVAGEFFHPPDRERMLERVKRTSKQCLIFKVYGAGRSCGSRAEMLDALRLAARYAKPSDCVVIGMFPKHKEQVEENSRLVVEAFRGTAS